MNLLADIQLKLNHELDQVNRVISSTLQTDNSLMDNVVSNYLKTKGKQIRPILVILSAKIFGNYPNDDVPEKTLYAAAALEMLHNASLIHDDVVDETTLRRNEPTINAAWGNRIAVLVGDYFVSNALAASIQTGNLSIISALSALGKELSLGEIDQITNVRKHDFKEDSYFSMIRKKTASLFRFCIKLGAESVNAPLQYCAPLVEYGELLGLCFQIKDDIFDYFSDPEIGKPTGNDIREGKVTLPLLYAIRTADHDGKIRDLISSSSSLSTHQINLLIDFAKANGGIEYAYERMRIIQKEADKILLQYPDSEWKDALKEIFEFIISRNH